MKPFLILSLMLFWVQFYSTAQADTLLFHARSTTLDEYNYLIKGYKIQIESGLDMKKGYYLTDVGTQQIDSYSFTIKNLMREDQYDLAGILVITYSGTSGRTYYTGIPINNPKLMAMYAADVAKWDRALSAAYTHLISSYLTMYFNANVKY